MDRKELALKLHHSKFNCCQSVACAFCHVMGQDAESTFKQAEAFGFGMGCMETCGAVSGMALVAGLLYGYDGTEGDDAKMAHYALVQELCGKFRDQAGSIVCRELLDNPPSDPKPTPRTEEFYKLRPCAKCVYLAAEILDAYMAANPVG